MALWMAIVLVLSFPVAFAQDLATESNETPAETVAIPEVEVISEPAAPTEEVVSEPAAEVTDVEAEQIVQQAVEDAGVTPDSILYPIETTIDDARLALTTDDAAKAELAVEIADERLAEATVMIEENMTEEASIAQEQHDEAIATAETAVEAIESDGDTEQAQEALQTIAEVQAQITGHAAKVAAVKDAILTRMASKKSPEQLAHIQAVFDKIKAKAVEMEDKADAKKAKVKTKYKALAKKTDAEVDAEVATIDEKTGLKEAKVKAEKVNAKVTEKQKVKALGSNTETVAKVKGKSTPEVTETAAKETKAKESKGKSK